MNDEDQERLRQAIITIMDMVRGHGRIILDFGNGVSLRDECGIFITSGHDRIAKIIAEEINRSHE